MSDIVFLSPEEVRAPIGTGMTKGSKVVVSPLIPFPCDSGNCEQSYLVVVKDRGDAPFVKLMNAFGVNRVDRIAHSFPMTTPDSASNQYKVDVFVLRTILNQSEIERKINIEVLS